MKVHKLLTDFWRYVGAPATDRITETHAIEIAAKIYQEHGLLVNRVGIAWQNRNTFTLTTNAGVMGGGWMIRVDRRTGEAQPPFLIPR